MLSAICAACTRTKQRKTMCYDTQFRGYCLNVCCAEHPNSPINLKRRGVYAELMSYNDASEALQDRANSLYKSGAIAANKRQRAGVEMKNVLNETISFRLREEAHSEYIMYVMGREGFNKVSQAMHTILSMALMSDQEFLTHAAGISNLPSIPVRDHIENKLQAEKPTPPPPQAEEVFEI